VSVSAAAVQVMLVFEVGYKFRFFGEDARVAAAEHVCHLELMPLLLVLPCR
jgi:DNA mismatch repair ATPase MutS